MASPIRSPRLQPILPRPKKLTRGTKNKISPTSATDERKAKRICRNRYSYKQVHDDLENGRYAGSYGWDNAAYIAIAEKKAGLDLKKHHTKRSEDEYYIPSIKNLIDNPATQEHWHRIVTFDPYGMTATVPTIAATTCSLGLQELQDLERDGTVVGEDGYVNGVKAGIYYAWNLPELAERIELPEDDLREALFKVSHDPRLKDPNVKVYLPQVGGLTVYIFGDAAKIRDPLTEIAVRVHDACNGSDVFGTDICTCRPYLLFALRGCIEVAQRGGVGVFVYFRKEGRSLGEVTKFRVYNARKNQEGGDVAEKYFFHTENIAGVRDARFQGMMPDVLNWLGIHRIDWLFSMSNEKYDALVNAGIRIYQRVPLPITYVPKGAMVELTAKVADGYKAMEVQEDDCNVIIRDLRTIRKQCGRVFELAKQKKAKHFSVNMDKIPEAVKCVTDCIERFYPTLEIPMHSRFRHFTDEDMTDLMETKWHHLDMVEKVRRLIDLATVSVLVDAGAGPTWKYIRADGSQSTRSEGLALASFDMFGDGIFSSDAALKSRANSLALKNLNVSTLRAGFQCSAANPLFGLEGRVGLLNSLGEELEKFPEFFGHEVARPGNVVDYILRNVVDGKISVEIIWRAIMEGLEGIWPNHVSGIQRGDVWIYNNIITQGEPGSDLVPFHKLSQWLILSWLEPLQKLDFEVTDLELLTCLAEYRNGGLLIDSGVLSLRHEEELERSWNVGSELIVEWRALTIPLIDIVADGVREYFGKNRDEMTLAMILEGGTWRAGRLLAGEKRGGKPPIQIRSDGTAF